MKFLLTIVVILSLPFAAWCFPVPVWTGGLRAYVCQQTGRPPTIDGRLDDPTWQDVAWTADFVDIQGSGANAPRLRTTCALRWDERYLYIAARLVEPHVQATLKRHDAVIYHDNDFEVFIDPDGDNHLYYELEINALNTVWDLLLVRPYRDGGPAVNAWEIKGLQSAVHIDGTLNDPRDQDRGWTVELALPWAVLAECSGRPSPPAPGDIWRLNFSRVQWRYTIADGHYEKMLDPLSGQPMPEDNWVWSPQGLVAMHYPENWGEVLFVGSEYDGRPQRTINANPEHDSINIARALMDIYYAQQQWREDHGHFATTIAELESEHGPVMKKWSTPIETVDGLVYQLPHQWALHLAATPSQFTASLKTPHGVMTVNEKGRLLREPLHPARDGKCLKTGS